MCGFGAEILVCETNAPELRRKEVIRHCQRRICVWKFALIEEEGFVHTCL